MRVTPRQRPGLGPAGRHGGVPRLPRRDEVVEERDVRIFEHAAVVVQRRELVFGVDEEGVVDPGVVQVVRQRGDEQCEFLDVRDVRAGFGDGHVAVHGVRHVSRVSEVVVRVVVVPSLDPRHEVPEREWGAEALRGGAVGVHAVVLRGLAVHAQKPEGPEHQQHVSPYFPRRHRERVEVPGVDQLAVDVGNVDGVLLRGGECGGGVESARARALPLLSHL